MRSATKALSAAGERMAAIVAFDETIMSDLIQENIDAYHHAPRSSQYAFAEAIENLDENDLENLRNYYKPQVEYAAARLQELGAAMPDSHYKIEGAFYILADLSDLFGQEISAEAARALGKTGKIATDEELIYSLLFDNGVSIAPFSYFGMSNRLGYVRITCSGGEVELSELMDRLETRLVDARKIKQIQIEKQLAVILEQLNKIDHAKAAEFRALSRQILIYQTDSKNMTALALKKSNNALKEIISNAKITLSAHVVEIKQSAAISLQSFFRGIQGRKQAEKLKNEMDAKWRNCIDDNFTTTESRVVFYPLSPSKRLAFESWADYLKKSNSPLAAKVKTKAEEATAVPRVSFTPGSKL